MRSGVKAGLFASVVVAALIAGCGSDRPAPAENRTYQPTGSSGGFAADSGVNKPPGCGQKPDGTFCDCIDVPLFTDPPNMYFVLDRSGSMAVDSKWTQVRLVLAQIVRGLGPRANFGATIFPGFDIDACAMPKEILPISPGDPIGAVDGPTTTKLLDGTADDPNGGTPTAAALRFVLPILRGASGKTFAILATDGAPNCNTAASCSVDQCQPNIENFLPDCPVTGPSCCDAATGGNGNCLDSAPTTAAVAALKAAGIPVYIIGLPGTSTYQSLLDSLAVAGGTALPTSPKYYSVDSTASSTALLAALKKIAAKIVATCEFTLKSAPTDPNLVNVYLDEVVLPKEPVNGWQIDGTKVTLLGTACSKVLDGDVFDVRIITGCPTVGPR